MEQVERQPVDGCGARATRAAAGRHAIGSPACCNRWLRELAGRGMGHRGRRLVGQVVARHGSVLRRGG